MKVLLINNSYPTVKHPEKSTYIQSIKECLMSAGNDVDLLVLNVTGAGNTKYRDYMAFYWKLFRANLSSYDCLYINHYLFLIPLYFKICFYKGRVIFHWHGEELVQDRWFLRILRLISARTIKPAHIQISPSVYYKSIVKNVLKIPEDNIYISPSGGIDTKLFSRKKKHVLDTNFHIGFASDLSEHKGIGYFYELIKNTERLEEEIGAKVCFHCIKYGKDAPYWVAQLEKYPNVDVCEKIPKVNMFQYYHKLDLCLMLSKRESLGLVAIEAMSCNIPVIARNTTSMPEIVKSGICGEIVPFLPSISDLMEKIAYVYKNYNQYNPRPYVQKKYSKDSVVTFYRDLLK